MKNIFLLLFSLFYSAISFSQHSFVVMLDENRPEEGVKVFYHKKLIGITGPEGKFSMPQVPAGDTIVFEYGELTTKYVVREDRARDVLPQVIYLKPRLEFQHGRDYIDVPPPPPPMESSENEIFTIVEEVAEFPGGVKALVDWLEKNTQYPESAKQVGIQGKCYVKFIVEKDGSISDIVVLRGINGCPECDNESIRVVEKMPQWKPAKNNAIVVRSYFTLPISFKLK